MKKSFPLKHSWLNYIQCYSPGLWFSLTISLFAPTAVAQTNPQGSTPPFNTVTMPSPNAASLGKFGDITIGYHVGTPNIDVPIYEIKQGDLTVPISLKYQPGGIKVADIPSWVGSGWALIAGGVITRAIVGLPDELNQVSPKRKVGFFNAIGQLTMNGYPSSYPCEYITQTLSAGELDTEPDIFYFNFNGASGRFHFSYSQGQGFSVVLADQQNIAITYSLQPAGFTSWKIVSEDGNTFIFDVPESSTQIVQGSETESLGAVTSAWYLSKIVSANKKDSVLFSYANLGQSVIQQRSARDFRSAYIKDNYGGNGNSTITTSTSSTTTSTVYLSEIKSHFQKINFNLEATSGRGDTEIGNISFRLKNINIGTYKGAIQNNLSSFAFEYDIVGVRLFLARLQEFGQAPEGNRPYVFTYDQTWLPDFNSNDFDTWGYYNGAQNASALSDLRKLLPEGVMKAPWGLRYQSGAVRTPDANFMKAGVLTKITYPTGGKTLFEWEPHTYSSYAGVMGAEPVSWAIGQKIAQVIFSISNQNPNYPTNSPTWPYPVIVTYRVNCSAASQCENPTICNQIFQAGANTGTIDQYGEFGLIVPAGTPLSYSNLLGGVLPVGGGCQYNVSVDGEVRPILSTDVATAGGLRIKTLKNLEYNDELLVKRDFIYSNGICGNRVTYSLLLSSAWAGGDPGFGFLYARESSPIFSLSLSQGSHVAYSSVAETRQDGASTQYQYSNFDLFPDSHGETKIVMPSYSNGLGIITPCSLTSIQQFLGQPTSNESNRGRLLMTTSFGSNGAKIFEEENEYQEVAQLQNGTPCFSLRNLGGISGTQVSVSFANSYTLFTKLVQLKKTITREFSPTGTQKTTVKTLVYNVNSLRPNQIDVETSDGKITRTKIEYSPTIKSFPIHQSNWVVTNGTERVVSGNNVVLDPFALKPQFVNVLETAQPQIENSSTLYKPWYEYGYNSRGRQVVAKKSSDNPISYIWAPDNNFVYAEVQNAQVNEIFHTSFEGGEEGGNSLANDARTGTTSKTGGYTKTLSGLTPNKAYVLTYWQKNAGAWTLQTVNIAASASTSYTINLTGQVDEVRFHPQGALMTSYTHKPGVGITSVCDPKGLITTFEYDSFSRLWLVKDHFGKILKENKYNYKQ